MPQGEDFLYGFLCQYFGDIEDGRMFIENASKGRETQMIGYYGTCSRSAFVLFEQSKASLLSPAVLSI